MTKLKLFDPIVVDEVRARCRDMTTKLKRADQAATALLWFNKYAWGNEVAEVLKVTASPVASATSGADEAALFIKDAAANLAPDILEKAIRMAMHAMAENSGKQGPDYD